MSGKLLVLLCLYVVIASACYAQKIATFEVELTAPANGLVTPVRVELDQVTLLNESLLSLVQVKGSKKLPVSFQVSNEGQRFLTWMVSPENVNENKVKYELLKSAGTNSTVNTIKSVKEDGALTIQAGNKNLLRYNYKKVNPPAGVDTAYGRSGFIHPLWSPKGQVLTRIQPPDHYHHYGMWNPWTHVLYEGDTVDFWNLNKKEGTVRFSNFLGTIDGPVFSEYRVLHDHVVFKKSGSQKVAMNEVQTVRVFYPSNNDYYIADITIDLSTADKSPVLLLEYRYGGLGWRTTEQWNKDNSEVLTSEGKNRKEADGSLARWCIVQGAIDNDYAGAVMMSYPSNYNHPEPLRIWPETQYDRGDMFANFSPTKNKDWSINPGKVYSLKYRFIVFNGKFTKEKAESAWQYFVSPPKVTVTKNQKS